MAKHDQRAVDRCGLLRESDCGGDGPRMRRCWVAEVWADIDQQVARAEIKKIKGARVACVRCLRRIGSAPLGSIYPTKLTGIREAYSHSVIAGSARD